MPDSTSRPPGAHPASQQRRHALERIGEDIGDDDVVLARREVAGQAEVGGHVIQHGVVARGGDGLGVDVDAVDPRRAQLGRSDREDAGAAAIIQQRFAAGELRIEPAQAQPRGGMAAGAECQAGVELEVDRAAVGGRVPGRHDPQTRRDRDGVELRLGEAHPVLLGHGFDRVVGGGGNARLLRRHCQHSCHIGVFFQQHHRDAVRPQFGGRVIRFAEQRRFVERAGVGVLQRHRQRACFHQRVGQWLGLFGVDEDADGLPGHGSERLAVSSKR